MAAFDRRSGLSEQRVRRLTQTETREPLAELGKLHRKLGLIDQLGALSRRGFGFVERWCEVRQWLNRHP